MSRWRFQMCHLCHLRSLDSLREIGFQNLQRLTDYFRSCSDLCLAQLNLQRSSFKSSSDTKIVSVVAIIAAIEGAGFTDLAYHLFAHHLCFHPGHLDRCSLHRLHSTPTSLSLLDHHYGHFIGCYSGRCCSY